MKLASNDIYMGAIPWVLMQLILVGVVIAFPQSVTVFLEKEKLLDPETATRMLQEMGSEAKRGAPGSASAPGTAAPTPAEDDPMEAVRRAIGQGKK